MVEQYTQDEIVNATFKRVRVHEQAPDGTVTIKVITRDGGVAYLPLPPQTELERIAPPDWPPQESDVWGDHSDREWFAVSSNWLVPAGGAQGEKPGDFLKKYGPPQLRHRRNKTDTAELDEARERVKAGLALADEWEETITSEVMRGQEWEQCLRANLPRLRAALGVDQTCADGEVNGG